MSENRHQILNDSQVKQIMKRLAYQVYEKNFNEKELIIGGIKGRGMVVAQMLQEQLGEICKLKTVLLEVSLNKETPSEQQVTVDNTQVKLADKTILVVDDVLNTGKTLLYALVPFVKAKSKTIQTLVLVDRNHKAFPVSADFIGTSLSTTLQEHISVSIERKKINVYLS